jgi:hypothetical protein
MQSIPVSKCWVANCVIGRAGLDEVGDAGAKCDVRRSSFSRKVKLESFVRTAQLHGSF